MKHFLLGIGAFAGISLVIYAIAGVLTALTLDKETIGTILMIGALAFIAKPFGELTASVFKLNIK
jgi:CDP-diglyceride synthetase